MQKQIKLIQGLILHNEVYTSSRGINRVVEATLYGEPIYCMLHTKSGKYALMEHTADVLSAITERNGAITLSKGQFTFKKNLTLQKLLYSVCNDVELESLKDHRISLKDNSLRKYGCYDFRKQNLRDARNEYSVGIVNNSDGTPEFIRFCSKEKQPFEIASILDYSPELYKILEKVSATWRGGQERHYIRIDGKGKPMQIARLSLLYETHFEQYKDADNPLGAFIADIPYLDKYYTDRNLVAAHINGHKWNNCIGNVMWMSSHAKYDYITRFLDTYKVYTALADDGTILVVLNNNGIEYGFALESAEKYANLQRIALGVINITRGLKLNFGALSPKEVYKKLPKDEKSEGFSVVDCVNWKIKAEKIRAYYAEKPEVFKRLSVPYIIPSSGHAVTQELLQDVFRIFVPNYYGGEILFGASQVTV